MRFLFRALVPSFLYPISSHAPPDCSRASFKSSDTLSGMPINVLPSFLSETAPGGAPLGFVMCFGSAVVTGDFLSVLLSL